jgi:hypothetical protein
VKCILALVVVVATLALPGVAFASDPATLPGVYATCPVLETVSSPDIVVAAIQRLRREQAIICNVMMEDGPGGLGNALLQQIYTQLNQGEQQVWINGFGGFAFDSETTFPVEQNGAVLVQGDESLTPVNVISEGGGGGTNTCGDLTTDPPQPACTVEAAAGGTIEQSLTLAWAGTWVIIGVCLCLLFSQIWHRSWNFWR